MKVDKTSEISVEKTTNMLTHLEIKEEMVLGILKSIMVAKSPGLDGIYLG